MTNTEPISPSLALRNRHLSEKTSMAHGLAKLLTGVLKYNRLQKTEAQLSLMNPPLVGHWWRFRLTFAHNSGRHFFDHLHRSPSQAGHISTT
jgi:hypothetical protein